MTLAERIRQHLAENGADTNKHIALVLDVPLPKVCASTLALVKKGDCTSTPGVRTGQYRPESTFDLRASVVVPRDPKGINAALDAIGRAWG